jgi:MFS family permease
MRRYLSSTLHSLANRNFRIFFTAQSISITGTWMQKVAQVLLVLQLSGSGLVLGITVGLQEVPVMLFTVLGGLLADRLDKRQLLIWAQLASAVPALVLAGLTASGGAKLWMVWVLALVIGSVEAIEKPTRMSFVVEMVGPESVTNAVALNNITVNAGKIVGPAVAGIVIGVVGLWPCFLVNAASFGVVILGLLRMNPHLLSHPSRPERARGQVREGLAYVRSERVLFDTLLLLAIAGTLAYNWNVTLPLLARDDFNGSPTQIGFLFTAMGAGAVFGSLAIAGTLVASISRLVATSLIFAVALCCTAWAPSLALVYPLLVVLGTASIAFRAVASAIVQLWSAPEMRGRTMSLLVLATAGSTPIGAPIMGWVSASWGPRSALLLGGLGTAVAGGAAWLRLRGDAKTSGVLPAAALTPESTGTAS